MGETRTERPISGPCPTLFSSVLAPSRPFSPVLAHSRPFSPVHVCSNAWSVFLSSMAIVIFPTPPGTGVMADATSATGA